ncbi:hypothetical protein CGQ24_10610 [Arthrobacter sp. 7749]|nr:hypothetical protein CGQ24_10610 [Arthrobacter sp. 7749]
MRGNDQYLLLAKFPKTSENRDVSAWELAMIKLLRWAEFRVQDSWTFPLREDESIFLTHRFDREGKRRGSYMSSKHAFLSAD